MRLLTAARIARSASEIWLRYWLTTRSEEASLMGRRSLRDGSSSRRRERHCEPAGVQRHVHRHAGQHRTRPQPQPGEHETGDEDGWKHRRELVREREEHGRQEWRKAAERGKAEAAEE